MFDKIQLCTPKLTLGEMKRALLTSPSVMMVLRFETRLKLLLPPLIKILRFVNRTLRDLEQKQASRYANLTSCNAAENQVSYIIRDTPT